MFRVNRITAAATALSAFVCVLSACSHPVARVTSLDPVRPTAVVPDSPDDHQDVFIVVGVVPATQQAGQPCFLQVKVLPKQPIAAGTLSVVTDGADINVVPREIELKDIHPPVPGRNAPGRSPPEPPALGVVPVYTFRIDAVTPGSHILVVRFAYGDKEVRQQLTIKGDTK